jgi:hypothetical protein
MRREEDVHELGRVSNKLRGLYDAIADGLRTPGLQQELLLLEGRQATLKKPWKTRRRPRLGSTPDLPITTASSLVSSTWR